MTCPSCGASNEPGRKFCGECGARLARTCPNCGLANGPTVRFCGDCGTRLDEAAASAGGAAPGSAPAAAGGYVSPADRQPEAGGTPPVGSAGSAGRATVRETADVHGSMLRLTAPSTSPFTPQP